MNQAYYSEDFGTMRKRPKKKSGTGKPPSRKNGKFCYPNLNDLLVHYPLTTVNEYGEKVIRGKRIC